MDFVLNKLALKCFDLRASKKGYHFKQITTAGEYAAANLFYETEEMAMAAGQKTALLKYRKSTANFIAFYNNAPVGVVRMIDPSKTSRSQKLYGTEEARKHYEIQSMTIKKDSADESQFIILGLFKEMYAYSLHNGIYYWNSGSLSTVYQAIRRYCKEVEQVHIDFESIKNPLTQYMVTRKIMDTRFTVAVDAFEPWKMLRGFSKNFLKKLLQKPGMGLSLKAKNPDYAGLTLAGSN